MKALLTFVALLGLSTSAMADPVSAIISIITIASTGGAVIAGTASLLGGLAFAGASLSLIGNVTGNEKLARIGAVVGAGAGLANLAKGAIEAASAGTAADLADASRAADAAGASYEASAAEAALSNTPTAVDAAADIGAVADPGAQALADAGAEATQAGQAYAAPSELAGAEAPAGPAAAAAQGKEAGSITKVGKFIKDNKELVDLGGGLVKGAMGPLEVDTKLKSQREYLQYLKDKDAAFSTSVTNGAKVPFRVNPNAQVTQVDPQDPNRYVPVRGLVNRAIQGA